MYYTGGPICTILEVPYVLYWRSHMYYTGGPICTILEVPYVLYWRSHMYYTGGPICTILSVYVLRVLKDCEFCEWIVEHKTLLTIYFMEIKMVL